MGEEKKIKKQPDNEIPGEIDAENVIKKLEEIKASTVPKKEYEKIVSERDKFRDALLNGTYPKEDEENLTRKELAEKVAAYKNGNTTNLEYIETVLKLRDAALLETGEDPFESSDSPEGFGKKVADGLAEMIKEAAGRPEAFLGIYQAGVRDEKIKARS